MNRRETIIALVALDAVSPAVRAQRATGVPRIGYLSSNLAGSPNMTEGFRQGLRDHGYVEGHNVVVEIRDADGKLERLPVLAAELAALKVDVIVVGGTSGALAAKQATRTVPVVFISAVDPVMDGLVASLARPGGNVTGLATISPELVGKGLEQIKRAVPEVTRLAVLWQPGALGERTNKDMLKEADTVARSLRVRLQFVEARAPADFDRPSRTRPGWAPGLWLCCRAACSLVSADALRTWPQRTGCRLRTLRESLSMPGASCPMDRTLRICFDAPLFTSTRSSRAPSRQIFLSSNPPSSSWSSTSRRPRPSA